MRSLQLISNSLQPRIKVGYLIMEIAEEYVSLTKFGCLAHRIVARVDQLGGEVVDSSIQVVDYTV